MTERRNRSESSVSPSTRAINRSLRTPFDLARLTRPAMSEPRLARGESNGGGAGIRTPVRKYVPAGIYDAYPPLSCRARREEAEQPPGTNPEKSRR
jgi:hypothetical protein